MTKISSMIAATSLTFICGAGIAYGADLPVTIVTLGDTLINGFKIDNPADRFSANVAAGLLADGHKVVFQDAGQMDDTAGDLQWVLGPDGQALLANAANHVLIIETGGDECGTLKLEQTKANLDKILAALAAKNIPVPGRSLQRRPRGTCIFCDASGVGRNRTLTIGAGGAGGLSVRRRRPLPVRLAH